MCKSIFSLLPYSFGFFIFFPTYIFATNQLLNGDTPAKSHIFLVKGLHAMNGKYILKNENILSIKDNILKQKKQKIDCNSVDNKAVNKLKAKDIVDGNHILKNKIDCSGDKKPISNLKTKYILKKRVLKKKKILSKKVDRSACIGSSLSGVKNNDVGRVDFGNTSRLLKYNYEDATKNLLFNSCEKLPALKSVKREVGDNKEVFDKSCQQLRKIAPKKIDSFDKSCQQLGKIDPKKKIDSFDRSCQQLGKIAPKIDSFDKSCQQLRKIDPKKKIDSFDKSCQQLGKIAPKIDSFDKSCQQLKKITTNKIDSFDKSCQVSINEQVGDNTIRRKERVSILKRGAIAQNNKEGQASSNKQWNGINGHMPYKNVFVEKLDAHVEAEKCKWIKKTRCTKGVGRSGSVGLKEIRIVNARGVPVVGGPFGEDDIRLCSFTYCPIDAFSLDLRETMIKDLSPLSKLVQLKHLILPRSFVDDFSPLSNLFTLEYLDLSMSSVKDLKFLGKLINLRFLYCVENDISDITPLRRLVNLEYLNLCQCSRVNDISPLSSLSKLVSLFLERTGVKDLAPLSGNVNLKYLYLSYTQVVDISPLSSLVNLEELLLAECSDYIPLLPIKNLNNIVRLDLSWHERIDVKIVKRFLNLRILDLSNTNITTVDLVSLSNGSVRNTLTVLHLNSCNYLKRLYPLPGFVNLKELSLSFCQNRYLSTLKTISSLTKLSLRGIYIISDIEFLRSCIEIRELDLGECIALERIDAVCNLSSLQYLNVSECPMLFSPDWKVQETLSIFPFVNNLRTLDISYNNIKPADLKKLKKDFVIHKSSASVICNEY